MSSNPLDLLRKIPLAGTAVSEAEAYGRRVLTYERRPVLLYVAQVFLFVIVAVYFTKLTVIVMGLVSGYGDYILNMMIYVVDVFMMIVTLDAILGISSRKPVSWRKVQRSSMLLFLFSVAGVVLGVGMSASSLVTLSPALVAVICVPVSGIMFMKSVRSFYIPPMHDMPPMKDWIGYAFFSQLFPAERYEIEY